MTNKLPWPDFVVFCAIVLIAGVLAFLGLTTPGP